KCCRQSRVSDASFRASPAIPRGREGRSRIRHHGWMPEISASPDRIGPAMRPAPAGLLSLNEIVENGLCIGCGLCKSIADAGEIEIVMTREGRERPVARRALSEPTLARINAVCPGTRIEGPDPIRSSDGAAQDTVWGSVERLCIGHANDP